MSNISSKTIKMNKQKDKNFINSFQKNLEKKAEKSNN